MDQWKKLLASFTVRQRLTILVAAVAVGAALITFARWKKESDFRPLYTALAAEDAGAVIQRLKETGVDYRLSEDGNAVLVPSARVAEMRLAMASAGLPKNGRIGFELFDRTQFGATEFTEHVNYRRALEGELERSVISLAEVEQARVHLTFAKDSVFVDSRQPAKGSVMLRLKPGARLTPENVLAISHLVASAVESLAPEAVSVLDVRGNLLSRPRKTLSGEDAPPSEAMIEFRRSIERDLVMKIHSTLEPLVGPEKFRVSVSVDCDFSSGEQSEETFDPARSVMVSSQKTEDLSGTAASSGVPGTASNLPRPTSSPGAGQAGLSRRTESIAYQSSRVVRRVRLPQGTVQRMSVAVLLDHGVRWEGEGTEARPVLVAPAAETLQSIRDLVAGAIGFSAERGDHLIVESLPFETTLRLEPPQAETAPPAAQPSPLPGRLETMLREPVWVLLAASGAALLLVVVAVRLLWRRSRRRGTQISMPPELAAPAQTTPSVATAEPRRPSIEEPSPPVFELPAAPVKTKKTELLTGRLREIVQQDPPASAQVLRSWLSEEED